jgi:hypothetical protein
MLKNWTVKESDCGQYLYVFCNGKAGQIVIKAESEGFVADIFDDADESVATAYAFYNELEV